MHKVSKLVFPGLFLIASWKRNYFKDLHFSNLETIEAKDINISIDITNFKENLLVVIDLDSLMEKYQL